MIQSKHFAKHMNKKKKLSDKANILKTLNKYNRMTFWNFLPIPKGISKYNQ